MSYLLNVSDQPAGWNYSDPNKPGYMPSITGTLVSIEEVQSTNYKTREKETWPDGNPKLNIRFVIQGRSGRELPWEFQPKGSVAANAVRTAIKQWNPEAQTMAEIGGMMVRITTQGDSSMYHNNNPRPWNFEILGLGEAEFRGVKEFSQPAQQPQPSQQSSQAPVQQPVQQVQQPLQQQAPTVQQQPSPQQTQPAQQQQPSPQPQGYAGAGLYDEDIPF